MCQLGPSDNGLLSGIPIFFGDPVMADQRPKRLRIVCVHLEPKRDANDLIAKAFQVLRSWGVPREQPVLTKPEESFLSKQEIQA